MKKIFTLILALFMILNIQAQNNSTENQIASAIIGGIVAGAAASVAYNQYEERVELIATNYILDNYPEYKNFYLSLSNHSKANDYIGLNRNYLIIQKLMIIGIPLLLRLMLLHLKIIS